VKPLIAKHYGVDTIMPEATRKGVEDIKKGEIDKRKKVWEDRPPKSRRRRLQHRRKRVYYSFLRITCESDGVFVQLGKKSARLMRRLKRKDWRRQKLSVLLQKKRRRDLFVIPQKISIYDYQTRTGRLG